MGQPQNHNLKVVAAVELWCIWELLMDEVQAFYHYNPTLMNESKEYHERCLGVYDACMVVMSQFGIQYEDCQIAKSRVKLMNQAAMFKHAQTSPHLAKVRHELMHIHKYD